MQRDPRAYLWDAHDAISAIQNFVRGVNLDVYVATPMMHSAVERKFEIIGEALGHIARLDPDLAERIPDLSNIVAFRNLLIHGYAVVEHGRVWRVIHESLPALDLAVAGLLDELDKGSS